MKKLILFFFCLVLTATSLSAQQNIYVINNQTVENFDGTQLNGKTVVDYKITTTGRGRKAVTVHSITAYPQSGFTSPVTPKERALMDSLSVAFQSMDMEKALSASAEYSGGKNALPKTKVYVINGVKHEDESAFQNISPADIESLSVLNAGVEQYCDDCTVIMVRTKQKKQ